MTKEREYPATTGVLLAGGTASRLGGGDKGLLEIAGRSLLARAITILGQQCGDLILSVNGDAARFSSFGLTTITDTIPGRLGPLAGVQAALDHVALQSNSDWLLSAPADCPFLPVDLASRMHQACRREQTKIAIARSASAVHPIVALWHVSLRADLYRALVGEDVRKARSFVARHPYSIVDWPDYPVDPFFNVNTPDDLKHAAEIAATLAS